MANAGMLASPLSVQSLLTMALGQPHQLSAGTNSSVAASAAIQNAQLTNAAQSQLCKYIHSY